jgi:molybdate transport system permease protein
MMHCWLEKLFNVLGHLILTLLAATGIALILLPLLGLAWRSLHTRAWESPLENRVSQALQLSLESTAISLFFIILLGTPLAYFLARRHFPFRRLINVLVELPIILPPAVAGLGLLLAFGRRGLVGAVLFEEFGIRLVFTQNAVILAQIFVAMPFYIRAAQMAFQNMDREIENAALVDGANEFWAFVYVTFPLTRRALIAGALTGWARALGEFGATILFAGSLAGRTQTMPLLIYDIFETDINAAIWTALLLVGIAASVVALTRFLGQTDQPHPPQL